MKKRLTPFPRPSSLISRPSSEHGVALILTLGILVLLTLLVIAFAVSMRVESTASKNFNDLIKAREVAKAAIDEAVATLHNATPPITPTVNYVTAPGVIYTWLGGAWSTSPLFTVVNTGSVDLNANNLITGISAAYPAGGSQLWVGWSNVVVTVNGVNQLVGRYAYWVDDESTKVNVNAANSRGVDLEGWMTAAIDLPSLSALGGNIPGYVSTRPLDTIQSVQMKPLPGVSQPAFLNNQFYLTVNSTSPDITPWGTKRLNLSNVVANFSAQQAVSIIASNLSDGNFALSTGFGGTFSNKYPNVQQIAANIVDYIRAPFGLADQIPTDSSGSGYADTTPPAYLGLRRTPYINELVVSSTFVVITNGIPPLQNYLSITNTVSVELWYMYTNQAWRTSVYKPDVLVANLPTITVQGVPSFSLGSLDIPYVNFPPVIRVNMPAGTYGVVSGILTTNIPLPDAGPKVVKVNLVGGAVTTILRSQPSSARLHYAQIPLSGQSSVTLLPDKAWSPIWAAQCNDPRASVSMGALNWVADPSPTLNGVNTTAFNPGTFTTVTTGGSLSGDGDTSCHIVSGSNQRGTMFPGELAYIHTGVPWRAFWLQPQNPGEPGAPDWAVLDLFSATDTTNVIGRMNINSAITNANATLARQAPLFALLTNSLPSDPVYNNATAVNKIDNYWQNVSPTYRITPTPLPLSQYSYTLVGEIANTASLSNPQLVDPTQTKAFRETPVRGIANLITPRSNTFAIWAIAQSMRQTPATIFVTGEVKVQAIVERYEDPPGTVRFRTRYFRYFYN